MKTYLKGLSIIFASLIIGEIFNSIFSLPIPETVLSMIIVFVLLQVKIIKIEDIEKVAKTFLLFMPMFFLPSAVGLIESFSLVSSKIVQILLIVLVSTFLTIVVSGLVVQKTIDKYRGDEDE